MTARTLVRAGGFAVALAALAACGGGGSSSSAVVVPPAVTPTPVPTALSGTSVVHVAIAEPIKAGSGRTRVPSHLPASTLTIRVIANGQQVLSVPYVVAGPSCVTGTSSVTCTYDATVPNGDNTLLIQALGKNQKPVASATVQQTIAAPVTLPVTLLGIPARVAIGLAATAPLGTPTTVPITITAYDVDVNKIAGTFATPVQLADDDTTGHTALTSASLPSSTSSVGLTYDGKIVNANVKVVGGIDTASFTGSLASHVYAIPSGTTTVAPNTGIGSMIALADGTVWFGLANGLGRIRPDGSIAEFPVTPNPTSLIAGPDGAVWYVTAADASTGARGQLVRWNGDGTVRKITIGAPGRRVALGADNNFWITDSGAEVIKVTPAGAVTTVPIVNSLNNGLVNSGEIVSGPDGNLWIGDQNGRVYVVAPASGQIATYSLTSLVSGNFVGMGFAADGALWVTGNSGFLRLPPGGGTAVLQQLGYQASSGLLAGSQQPVPIFTASDGNLWSVTTSVFNLPYVMVRVTPQGAAIALPLLDPRPAGIDGYSVGVSAMIPGPNGTIWYEIGSTVGSFTVPQ